MTIARRILYSGQVQGVGFRFTTRELAQGFAVAGYVRNLPDGQVEVLVEGEPGEVDRFLDAVGRRMAEYIATRHIFDEVPGRLDGFEIHR